jgi:hypothetical protein
VVEENDMKTSIFDMNFTLPPLVEMTQVEKDMPTVPTNFVDWLYHIHC